MRLALGMAAAMIVCSPASAGSFRIDAVETPGVEISFQNGMTGAERMTPLTGAFTVLHRNAYDDKDRVIITLSVMNKTDRAFHLTPASVAIATSTGSALRHFTHDELVSEARKSGDRSRKWAKIGAGLAAMNAGSSTTTGSFNGSVGPVGRLPEQYSGTFRATTTNPLAAAIETRQIAAHRDARLAEIEHDVASKQARAGMQGFKSDTLEPGEIYTTALTLDRLPRGTNGLKLSVTTGPDVHTFEYKITR